MAEETLTLGLNVGDVAAYLVKDGDEYFVEALDGTRSDACKIVEDGKTIALPENLSKRQWQSVAKAEAYFAENGTDKYPLALRGEKRVLGSYKLKDPNEQYVKYLTEEEKAEYDAIIADCRARYEAAHPKKVRTPKTKEEKAMDALQKAVADLEAYYVDHPDDAQVAAILAKFKTSEVK